MKNDIINESNCLTCQEAVRPGEEPHGDLQEVCRKLDIVIQLLKNLQVNLNINGDMCNVTVFDDGRVRMNRKM